MDNENVKILKRFGVVLPVSDIVDDFIEKVTVLESNRHYVVYQDETDYMALKIVNYGYCFYAAVEGSATLNPGGVTWSAKLEESHRYRSARDAAIGCLREYAKRGGKIGKMARHGLMLIQNNVGEQKIIDFESLNE